MPDRVPARALLTAGVASCLMTICTPTNAQDIANLFGWAADGPARGAPVSQWSWRVTVRRTEPAVEVAAADPAWTARVTYVKAPLLVANPIPRAAPRAQDPITGRSHVLAGLASYYHEQQMTSSGERFDRSALTAAHRTLPLNTWVRVTNEINGRSVVVRINDRGPFKPGRIIDLSEAAAQSLDMTALGLVPVKLQIVKN